MTELLSSYLPIIVFLGISLVIGAALLLAPFVVAFKAPDPEKLSAYECGFNAFDDARMKFDVRFYLVAILFIIFDLEVAFLFPWAVSFGGIGWFGFWSMMVFLAILTVGFAYEWRKGALEWQQAAIRVRSSHRSPRASSTPPPASRLAQMTPSTARSTTNWPTRVSSSPPPTN